MSEEDDFFRGDSTAVDSGSSAGAEGLSGDSAGQLDASMDRLDAGAPDTGRADGSTRADPAMSVDGGSSSLDAGSGCLPEQVRCGGLCVDLKNSAANCGSCGHVCPGNQGCDGSGQCTAPAGCAFKSLESHDYFFCTEAKNWSDSRSACLGWGMDLAVIESAAENDFIKGASNQWIGLNDRDDEGTWLWIPRGTAASTKGPNAPYTNWHADEPNSGRSCGIFTCTNKDEDCAEVYADGTWNDGQCGNTHGFVCETF